ncbi:hypothetical protein, partial [Megasphaera massiliensis]|uniref:hypothetical protein n=1 Tax=Megasphaera massiliensis TaxID=1232428 RepID=UPI003AF0854D
CYTISTHSVKFPVSEDEIFSIFSKSAYFLACGLKYSPPLFLKCVDLFISIGYNKDRQRQDRGICQ